MSGPVKIPVGQSFGMDVGAKVLYQLSEDQWCEMVVNKDIKDTPFTITDTKIGGVLKNMSSSDGTEPMRFEYSPSKEGIGGGGK